MFDNDSSSGSGSGSDSDEDLQTLKCRECSTTFLSNEKGSTSVLNLCPDCNNQRKLDVNAHFDATNGEFTDDKSGATEGSDGDLGLDGELGRGKDVELPSSEVDNREPPVGPSLPEESGTQPIDNKGESNANDLIMSSFNNAPDSVTHTVDDMEILFSKKTFLFKPNIVNYLELELCNLAQLYHYMVIAVYKYNKQIYCAYSSYNAEFPDPNTPGEVIVEVVVLVTILRTKCVTPRFDSLWYRVSTRAIYFVQGNIYYETNFNLYIYIYNNTNNTNIL